MLIILFYNATVILNGEKRSEESPKVYAAVSDDSSSAVADSE
jgi:hypothetical protein